MTRKTVLKYWLWVVAAAFGAASATAEVKTDVNLVPAIRAAGKSPTFTSTATQGTKANVNNLFDEIITLSKEDEKYKYMKDDLSAIFIDDSFSERMAISNKLKLPVFDLDAVESLIDWRM